MADPNFRSLSQIVGEMVSTFLAELSARGIAPGIQSLKPGSPYLAIFEAVGQSQFRNQEQSLSLLDANDLSLAHGERLDRIGQSEKLPRRGATFASGFVTVSDSSFTKKSSRLYQGLPTPIVGSNTIYVNDASNWPVAGQVYIGRGTTNVEGPLAYSSVVNSGGYWTVNLSVGATASHGYGEVVTVAQGGDRAVAAGQTVATSVGGVNATSVSYSTTSKVTLLDGETEVANVAVTCQKPGSIGRASAGSINTVPSPAFPGMGVTNPLPLTNGLDVEADDMYRARIQSVRQSKQRGTQTAIETFAYGVTAQDEGATCIHANLVQRTLLPTLLVIDDGTGYEEKTSGVASEVLVQSAVGGETTFYLQHGRPVAKAAVTTVLNAPYTLVDGSVLTVRVRQVNYDHTFQAEDFRNIGAATAYEVVNSINSNPALPFQAHTVNNGLQVAVFVETDDNDDIQVSEGGANDNLLFPTAKVETLRLYKNDRLLTKDGMEATVFSASRGAWGAIAAGDTIVMSVDGTPAQTYYLNDSDFVALGTGLTAVSTGNPLESWAQVLNNKIPGITASVSGPTIQLVSNRGRNDSAAIYISPASTVVHKGMFSADQLFATGSAKDYVLNRNVGEVELVDPLLPGDSLVAGSPYTRGYLESGSFNTITIGDDAFFWLVVDGDDAVVSHAMSGANRLRMSWTQNSTPVRRFTCYIGDPALGVPAYPFANIQVGDWAIFTEDLFTQGGTYPTNFGAYRVSNVDRKGQWFETEDSVTTFSTGYSDSDTTVFSKVAFIRSEAQVQQVMVPAATYTPVSLAATLSGLLKGAFSTATEDNTVWMTTNSYASEGKVTMAAMDLTARSLLFPLGSSINNDTHLASVESGNSDIGTPHMSGYSNAVETWDPDTSIITGTDVGGLFSSSSGWMKALYWMRANPTHTNNSRYSSNAGRCSNFVVEVNPGEFKIDGVLHNLFPSLYDALSPDRATVVGRYRFGPKSTLNLVLDNDPLAKGFAIQMGRQVTTAPGSTYSSPLMLRDFDGGRLGSVFGHTFDFSNFILHCHSRTITHISDVTKKAMWRVRGFNARTTHSYCGYLFPTVADSAVSILNTAPFGEPYVTLASGPSRPLGMAPGDKVVFSGGTTMMTIASAFTIATIERQEEYTVVITLNAMGDVAAHGLSVGDAVYVYSEHPDFPSGWKTVEAGLLENLKFSYTEPGTSVLVNNPSGAFVSMDSTPIDFSLVQVNDVLAMPDVFGDIVDIPTASNLKPFGGPQTVSALRVASTNPYYVQVVVPLGYTTPAPFGWVTLTSGNMLDIYPIVNNTVAEIVTAVNALGQSIVGVLPGGPTAGTGIVSQDANEDAEAFSNMVDGALHVQSASYVALSNDYQFYLKLAPDATLVAENIDWANEDFMLVPTTAANVVDFLSAGNATGLSSTGVSVLAANRGGRVQITSGILGSGSSVQVSGGTANALSVPVLGRSLFDVNYILLKVANTTDIEAMGNRQMVAVNNSIPLPKTKAWGTATTFTVDGNGQVTLGGTGGSAWGYSNGGVPVFGDRWYVEKVGRLTAYTLADRGLVDQGFALPAQNDWVRMESGEGAWLDVGARPTATTYIGATVVKLSNGKVLYAGGTTTPNPTAAQTVVADSWLFDPLTDAWVATSEPMSTPRAWHQAVTLGDGRVMVIGGLTATSTWTGSCEIYNPATDTWEDSLDLQSNGGDGGERSHHTATYMPSSGEVYVVGGVNANGALPSTVNVQKFTGFSWEVVGNGLPAPRYNHGAVVYGGSKLIVFGGCQSTDIIVYNIYGIGVWTTVGHLTSYRYASAYTVIGSSLFVFGGTTQGTEFPGTWANTIVSTVERINLVDFSSIALAPMKVRRAMASVVALSDTHLALIGGFTSATAVTRSAEVYSLTGNTWAWAVGAMRPVGTYGSAVALDDGRILGTNPTNDGGAAVTGGASNSETFNFESHSASVGNSGTFRVLLVDEANNRIWVENPLSVAEEAGFGLVAFYSYDSVMVGDTFRVTSGALGSTTYDGEYPVTALDLTDTAKFTVSTLASVPLVTPASKFPYLSVIPSKPSRMFFEIRGIYPDNGPSPTMYNLSLEPQSHPELVSPQAGSVVEFLDRLNFPVDISVGQDGYRYDTGLIGEVNKVVYGDLQDKVTYPGVAAAGAYIGVAAPLIRRVTVAVAIRAVPGAVDIKGRVQSAIAQVINSAPPAPIAISDIIEAVSGVNGVLSCVMLDPVPTTTSDFIPVQPGEKAMVLDVDSDIQVSFIGQ